MMLPPRGSTDRKDGLVAVAIDKDKNSQIALKWAIDHILQRGQTVILIHVKLTTNSNSPSLSDTGRDIVELFLPFRIFCIRKDIQCKDIVLEDSEVAKALTEYVTQMAIETLVVGAASKSGFLSFKTTDVPGTVLKGAPDFCTVYVISKGKIASTQSASRPAPAVSPLRQQIQASDAKLTRPDNHIGQAPSIRGAERPPPELPRRSNDELGFFRSPFTRRGLNGISSIVLRLLLFLLFEKNKLFGLALLFQLVIVMFSGNSS